MGQAAQAEDSLDFENSDDLNKIISKYELSLSECKKPQEQIEVERQLQEDYNFSDDDNIIEDEIIEEIENQQPQP